MKQVICCEDSKFNKLSENIQVIQYNPLCFRSRGRTWAHVARTTSGSISSHADVNFRFRESRFG